MTPAGTHSASCKWLLHPGERTRQREACDDSCMGWLEHDNRTSLSKTHSFPAFPKLISISPVQQELGREPQTWSSHPAYQMLPGLITFPSRSCSGRRNWCEKTLSPGVQLLGVWWPGGPGREDRGEERVTQDLGSTQPQGQGTAVPKAPWF